MLLINSRCILDREKLVNENECQVKYYRQSESPVKWGMSRYGYLLPPPFHGEVIFWDEHVYHPGNLWV